HVNALAVGDGCAGGIAVLPKEARERKLRQLRLEFLLPDHFPLLVETEEVEAEVLLIAPGGLTLAETALAALPLAAPSEPAALEALRDLHAVARVAGDEDLVPLGDGARGARSGQLRLPEDVVLGQLDRHVRVVGEAVLQAAKRRPVGGS